MGLFGLGKIKNMPEPPAPIENSSQQLPADDPFAVPTPDGGTVPAEEMPPAAPEPVPDAPVVDAIIEDSSDDPFSDPVPEQPQEPAPDDVSPAPEETLQMPDLTFDEPPVASEPTPVVDAPVPVESLAPIAPPVVEPAPIDEPITSPLPPAPDVPSVTNIFVEKVPYQRVLFTMAAIQEVLQSSEEGITPLIALDEGVVSKLGGLRGLLREVQDGLMAIDRRLFEKVISMVDDLTPVFVKIEEYKEVLDIIDVVKGKLAEAKATINEIESLKAQEDRELANWSRNIDAVEQKILAVDKTIFGKR